MASSNQASAVDAANAAARLYKPLVVVKHVVELFLVAHSLYTRLLPKHGVSTVTLVV